MHLSMKNYFVSTSLTVLVVMMVLFAGQSCKDGKDDLKPGDGDSTVTTYVRKNASTPEAQADLNALNKALAIMKKMPCDSTSSWYYQGGIHSIPSSVPNGNPLCPSFTQMAQMKTAWMNCTHDPMGASEIHFLLWHRLYIWHLEKIIRKQSGKKDFALPYWDYCDTNYRVMPEVFRNMNDSLYESARLQSLNAGKPIEQFMNKKLDMTKNNSCRLYSLFDPGIDAAPHGAMHNYIGGGYAGDSTMWNRIYQGPNYGLMAQVESAAFDPIFWVHHANIDYLWQRWDMSTFGRRPILDSLLLQPWAYVFFDENGNKVQYSIQNAYAQAFKMDYEYSGLEQIPKIVKDERPVPENREEILSSTVEKAITEPVHKLSVNVENRVSSMLQTKDLTKKAYVLEVTVGFTRQPKNDYEVYVDTDTPDDNKLAGIMTFFGAMHMQTPAAEYTKTFYFDITDEFDLKSMKGNLRVLIVNANGTKATDIKIKKIRIETRNF